MTGDMQDVLSNDDNPWGQDEPHSVDGAGDTTLDLLGPTSEDGELAGGREGCAVCPYNDDEGSDDDNLLPPGAEESMGTRRSRKRHKRHHHLHPLDYLPFPPIFLIPIGVLTISTFAFIASLPSLSGDDQASSASGRDPSHTHTSTQLQEYHRHHHGPNQGSAERLRQRVVFRRRPPNRSTSFSASPSCTPAAASALPGESRPGARKCVSISCGSARSIDACHERCMCEWHDEGVLALNPDQSSYEQHCHTIPQPALGERPSRPTATQTTPAPSPPAPPRPAPPPVAPPPPVILPPPAPDPVPAGSRRRLKDPELLYMVLGSDEDKDGFINMAEFLKMADSMSGDMDIEGIDHEFLSCDLDADSKVGLGRRSQELFALLYLLESIPKRAMAIEQQLVDRDDGDVDIPDVPAHEIARRELRVCWFASDEEIFCTTNATVATCANTHRCCDSIEPRKIDGKPCDCCSMTPDPPASQCWDSDMLRQVVRGKRRICGPQWDYLLPDLDPDESRKFTAVVRKTSGKYFEWGPGGVTDTIALLSARAISVDHHLKQCRRLKSYPIVEASIKAGKVVLNCVDTNVTLDAQGRPKCRGTEFNTNCSLKFKPYVEAIRDAAVVAGKFDVVFVNGRFRVACALKALAHLSGPMARVIVKDIGRYAKHLSPYFDSPHNVGRLGILHPKPGMVGADIDWQLFLTNKHTE